VTKRVQAPEAEPSACGLAIALKTRVLRHLGTSRDIPKLSTESMDATARAVGHDHDHGHTGAVVTDSSH
jgi:hypothetical protein